MKLPDHVLVLCSDKKISLRAFLHWKLLRPNTTCIWDRSTQTRLKDRQLRLSTRKKKHIWSDCHRLNWPLIRWIDYFTRATLFAVEMHSKPPMSKPENPRLSCEPDPANSRLSFVRNRLWSPMSRWPDRSDPWSDEFRAHTCSRCARITCLKKASSALSSGQLSGNRVDNGLELVWSGVTSVWNCLIRGPTRLGRSDQRRFRARPEPGRTLVRSKLSDRNNIHTLFEPRESIFYIAFFCQSCAAICV